MLISANLISGFLSDRWGGRRLLMPNPPFLGASATFYCEILAVSLFWSEPFSWGNIGVPGGHVFTLSTEGAPGC